MTTPLEQIDRLLADWATKAARIDQNLVDLTSEPVFGLVAQAPFEGATRDRVGPALAGVEELFTCRRLLEDVIDQARSIRATVTPLRRGHRLVQVEQLLAGPSIALPPQPTDAASRGLLDPDEIVAQATPAQVLESMVAAYDRVRAVVTEIDAAWADLTPRVDAADASVRDLEPAAHSAGAAGQALFAQVSAAIEAARHLVAADPLGAAPAAVAVLPGNLAALRRTLASTIPAPRAAAGRAGPGPADEGPVPE